MKCWYGEVFCIVTLIWQKVTPEGVYKRDLHKGSHKGSVFYSYSFLKIQISAVNMASCLFLQLSTFIAAINYVTPNRWTVYQTVEIKDVLWWFFFPITAQHSWSEAVCRFFCLSYPPALTIASHIHTSPKKLLHPHLFIWINSCNHDWRISVSLQAIYQAESLEGTETLHSFLCIMIIEVTSTGRNFLKCRSSV